jgi:hypothetical protein
MLEQRFAARGGRSIDPHRPTRLGPNRAQRHPGTDLRLAARPANGGRNRPAALAAVPGNLGHPRTPESAPRRKEGERLKKVGFPGAIRAGQHDGTRIE